METALIEILKGVPVAAVLLYFAIQFRKDTERAQLRNDVLVDKLLETSQEISQVVERNSIAWNRVEGKLDEAKH